MLRVARLSLTKEEYDKIMKDVDSILSLAKLLDELRFEGSFEQEVLNSLRGDEVAPFGGDLTPLFPKRKERFLEVPKNL